MIKKDENNDGIGQVIQNGSLSSDSLLCSNSTDRNISGDCLGDIGLLRTSPLEDCPHVPFQTQVYIEPEGINHLGVLPVGTYIRVLSVNNDPPLTRQADADQVCIHKIMSKFEQTGHFPVTQKLPLEGEIHAAEDYQEAMNVVAHVNNQFSLLPVETREFFGHQPTNLLKFMANEKNADRMVEMGLKPLPAEAMPQQSTAVPVQGGEGAKAPSNNPSMPIEGVSPAASEKK